MPRANRSFGVDTQTLLWATFFGGLVGRFRVFAGFSRSGRAASLTLFAESTIPSVKAELKQPASQSVYLVESGLGLARIGVAPDPQQRLRELQVGSPVRLELALVAPYAKREDARAVADDCPTGARPVVERVSRFAGAA